jgi:hypothetical protein
MSAVVQGFGPGLLDLFTVNVWREQMAEWHRVDDSTPMISTHLAGHRVSVSLGDLMEFDHVIEVHKDGSITEPEGIHAPELNDGELDAGDKPWRLIGNSRQQGGGQIMHNSEFVGGRLADMILESPGLYVAIVCSWDCNDLHEHDDCEVGVIEGWGLAHLPTEE